MQTEIPSESKTRRIFILVLIIFLCSLMITASFLIYNEIRKAPVKAKMECTVKYLTDKSYFDESFDSFGPFLGDPNWCEDYILNKISEIEESTQNKFYDITTHRSYAICMIKTLKNDSNFMNKVLLLEILDYTQVSWKIWKYFDRNARFKSLQNQIDYNELFAINYCHGKRNDNNENDGSGDMSDDTENDMDNDDEDLTDSDGDSKDGLYFYS